MARLDPPPIHTAVVPGARLTGPWQRWITHLTRQWWQGGIVQANGTDLSSVDFTTEADVVWATANMTDSVASVSGATVTFNEAARVAIYACVTADVSAQTEFRLRRYLDTGSGYGAFGRSKASWAADEHTVSYYEIDDVKPGWLMKFTGLATTAGTCTGINGATVLIIERKG